MLGVIPTYIHIAYIRFTNPFVAITHSMLNHLHRLYINCEDDDAMYARMCVCVQHAEPAPYLASLFTYT